MTQKAKRSTRAVPESNYSTTSHCSLVQVLAMNPQDTFDLLLWMFVFDTFVDLQSPTRLLYIWNVLHVLKAWTICEELSWNEVKEKTPSACLIAKFFSPRRTYGFSRPCWNTAVLRPLHPEWFVLTAVQNSRSLCLAFCCVGVVWWYFSDLWFGVAVGSKHDDVLVGATFLQLQRKNKGICKAQFTQETGERKQWNTLWSMHESVHTARKQRQRICTQICVLCLRVLCERGLISFLFWELAVQQFGRPVLQVLAWYKS